ncbi:MAG: polyphosphate kinase 2 family protein [Protaetiibacter sp.]
MSFAEQLRVGPGFRLAEVDPDATPGVHTGKKEGERALAAGEPELDRLQELLFANTEHDPRSVLLVLQAMDTAGKGGIVRHVVGAVDPQGVHIHAFKKPTAEELAHDFLWRVERELPGAGRIGVFDRSHYEDVLIGRVRKLADADEIERRYGAIVDFEERLAASGTVVVKCMLHISADEQRARLAERLDRPDKYWKFNPGDLAERALWDDYQEAYQLAIERTSTATAPWYVVPANHKWYARLAVAELLTDALRSLGQDWPPADFDVEEQRARLGGEGRS